MRLAGGASWSIGAGITSSGDASSRSPLNSDPKQSLQTPLAPTGVVHLLYFLPHVLQIATDQAGPTRTISEMPIRSESLCFIIESPPLLRIRYGLNRNSSFAASHSIAKLGPWRRNIIRSERIAKKAD
jgi:hypothetical protein